MRYALVILSLAALCVALGACSKKAATKASQTNPSGAAPVPNATILPAAGMPSPDAASASERPGAQQAAGTTEAPVLDEAAPKPADARVSEAECDKACAHATALSMASMPPDATQEMRSAIKKALEDNCPKECLEKGSTVTVQCILAAKTGMDLAACPK